MQILRVCSSAIVLYERTIDVRLSEACQASWTKSSRTFSGRRGETCPMPLSLENSAFPRRRRTTWKISGARLRFRRWKTSVENCGFRQRIFLARIRSANGGDVNKPCLTPRPLPRSSRASSNWSSSCRVKVRGICVGCFMGVISCRERQDLSRRFSGGVQVQSFSTRERLMCEFSQRARRLGQKARGLSPEGEGRPVVCRFCSKTRPFQDDDVQPGKSLALAFASDGGRHL